MASTPCPHCDGTIGATSPDTCYKCGRTVFSKPTGTIAEQGDSAPPFKDASADMTSLPSWLSPRSAPSLNLPQDMPGPPAPPPPTPPSPELSDTFEDDPKQLPLIELPSSTDKAQRRPRSQYRPRMIDPSKLTQTALF